MHATVSEGGSPPSSGTGTGTVGGRGPQLVLPSPSLRPGTRRQMLLECSALDPPTPGHRLAARPG